LLVAVGGDGYGLSAGSLCFFEVYVVGFEVGVYDVGCGGGVEIAGCGGAQAVLEDDGVVFLVSGAGEETHMSELFRSF
jgi:hypothetical protein